MKNKGITLTSENVGRIIRNLFKKWESIDRIESWRERAEWENYWMNKIKEAQELNKKRKT